MICYSIVSLYVSPFGFCCSRDHQFTSLLGTFFAPSSTRNTPWLGASESIISTKSEIMGMHFFVDQILHNSLKRFACAAGCLPKWLRNGFEIILDCEDRVVAAARMLFCLASLACFFACLETHCAASACSGNSIRGTPSDRPPKSQIFNRKVFIDPI